MASVLEESRTFMSVKQVAGYLQLNEKKVYALVNEGKIPATRVTGKWMFPRELVDRWMLNSAHGGLMADRLIVAGGDDPLLNRVLRRVAQDSAARALISHAPTGIRLGLDLLEARRVDVCGLHWGPDKESRLRHPSLLQQYDGHRHWVLIHAFRREQGLMINPQLQDKVSRTEQLLDRKYRWTFRQNGAGTQRYLLEVLARHQVRLEDLGCVRASLSDREAASAVSRNLVDVAPGTRATAMEYGLAFVADGWESYDFALLKDIWFRRLFQSLLARLKSKQTLELADELGGYDLRDSGELVWSEE